VIFRNVQGLCHSNTCFSEMHRGHATATFWFSEMLMAYATKTFAFPKCTRLKHPQQPFSKCTRLSPQQHLLF
jgi:hypothetical protein